MFLAGVEIGGTKTIVVTGDGRRIGRRRVIPTTTPEETMGRASKELQAIHADSPIAALGIASFGPIRVAAGRSDYGTILPTPKPGWTGAVVTDAFRGLEGIPFLIDTDVNAAALAEARLGAGKGCENVIYLTIGTGLGGGIVMSNKLCHGAMHPEVGHIAVRRMPGDDFEGACPFHDDCIEGLVAGPALANRFGSPPEQVPADDSRWDAPVHALAQLLTTLLLTLSPQRIVIGGGVGLGQPHLIQRARLEAANNLAGYLPAYDAKTAPSVVVQTGLGSDAGPLGSLQLAADASAGED